MKDLIIRGGHNIDPAVIEEPLHRHPAVQLAVAVGRLDAHAGELPVAYVQLEAGATATEAELLEWLRERIAEHAALPKQVRIVPQLPLTAVGKIHEPTLRRNEAREALAAGLREANLPVRAVEIVDDPSRGMVARLQIDDEASRERAQQVLGRFPIRFTIE